jgi:hypothetical protein
MSDTREIHRQAMALVHQSFDARDSGNQEEYIHFTKLAFELEQEAAMRLVTKFEAQPTRTVLFRSAATLALNAGLYAEAKKLVYLGLAGNADKMLEEQLNDVLVQALEKEAYAGKPYNLTPLKASVVAEPEGPEYEITPPLPLSFIGHAAARERILQYQNNKAPLLSNAIGKPDTLSVWYSYEEMKTVFREMKYLAANGLRIYLAAYPPEDTEHAGQTCLVMIPTRLEAEKIADVIMENEPGFAERFAARENLRNYGSEQPVTETTPPAKE